MIIGFDVYLWYGISHSLLSSGQKETLSQANKIGGSGGLALAILLAVIAFAHHHQTGADDLGIFYFSLAFAAMHILVFGMRMARK